jgi:hypothetical protein
MLSLISLVEDSNQKENASSMECCDQNQLPAVEDSSNQHQGVSSQHNGKNISSLSENSDVHVGNSSSLCKPSEVGVVDITIPTDKDLIMIDSVDKDMINIKSELHKLIHEKLRRISGFSTGSLIPQDIGIPAVSVQGYIGRLAFPLCNHQADAIIALAKSESTETGEQDLIYLLLLRLIL